MTLYELVSTLDASTYVTLYTRTKVGACTLVMHSDTLNVNELKSMYRESNEFQDVNICALKADGDKLYVGMDFYK